MYRTTV